MGFVREITPVMIGVALLSIGAPGAPEPSQALVVTQLADPDPDSIVPPEANPGRKQEIVEDYSLDQAMEQFGQALGQALHSQQQMMLQRCKASEAAAGTGKDRMAWEAACKYTRR